MERHKPSSRGVGHGLSGAVPRALPRDNHAGPTAGDASFRLYFVTAEDFSAAMQLAMRLEAKGMARRAWRVRLNLDGEQPQYGAPKQEEEENEEDSTVRPLRPTPLSLMLDAQAEVKRLIKQSQLSHKKLSVQLGVSQQSVSNWNKGGYISRESFDKLKKFVEGMKK